MKLHLEGEEFKKERNVTLALRHGTAGNLVLLAQDGERKRPILVINSDGEISSAVYMREMGFSIKL